MLHVLIPLIVFCSSSSVSSNVGAAGHAVLGGETPSSVGLVVEMVFSLVRLWLVADTPVDRLLCSLVVGMSSWVVFLLVVASPTEVMVIMSVVLRGKLVVEEPGRKAYFEADLFFVLHSWMLTKLLTLICRNVTPVVTLIKIENWTINANKLMLFS